MKAPGCVLIQTAGAWRISRCDRADWTEVADTASPDPEQLADAVDSYLRERQQVARQVVPALHARSTLAATFEIDETDARHRTALAYELENDLPWSAEETAADFMTHGNDVLGVGIEIETWLPIIEALETRDIPVQAIGSAALMALQDCAGSAWLDDANGVVWCDGAEFHVARMRAGRPLRWKFYGNDPAAVSREIAAESLDSESPLNWVIVNGDHGLDEAAAETAAWRNGESAQRVERIECPILEERVREQAGAVLSGKHALWFDFRRQALAVGPPLRALRGAVRILIGSLAVLVLSWITVFGYRTWSNERQAASFQQQQEQVFRELFPESRVPPAVESRLRSEHAKRFAARQVPRDLQLPVPALNVMRDFLEAFPEGPRVQVRELRIENGQLDLHADLRRHAAANELADSLRQHGFVVPTPSTEQNADHSVSVRLFAQWKNEPAAAGKGKTP